MLFVLRIKPISYRIILLDKVFANSLVSIGIHALFLLSMIALGGIRLPIKLYFTYYAMLCVVEPAWSLLSRRLIKFYRRKGYNYLRVAIVGANQISRRLYDDMLVDPGYGYKVMGFFDDRPTVTFPNVYLGTVSDLQKFVKEKAIDQIYYALPGDSDIFPQVVKIADDNLAEFFFVPQISQYVARSFHAENIGSVPVLSIQNNPLKYGFNRYVKRAFDIVFSLCVLAIYYPFIYLPVAIAIKLSSKGPVYFKQKRTGYKGKPFYCLKFRSMEMNSEADSLQATKEDTRTTRLGRFLRRSSLDEFPQFINVLKGEMSVVGPRPHMLKHTEEYSKLVDRYMMRHIIKPGITGWAQVNGYRGQTDELWKMEKRVESDMWYIEHWSFLLDLKIIVRTILNVFRHDDNAF